MPLDTAMKASMTNDVLGQIQQLLSSLSTRSGLPTALILFIATLLLAVATWRLVRSAPEGLHVVVVWAVGLKELILLLLSIPTALAISLLTSLAPGFQTVSFGELLARWSGGSAGISNRVFTVMRAYVPNLYIPAWLLKRLNVKLEAYHHQGIASITRWEDVREVAARDEVFEVMYEPRMRDVTGGENFLLGMANTPRYTRDISNMRLVFRRDDQLSVRADCEEQSRQKLTQLLQDERDESSNSQARFDVAERLVWPIVAKVSLKYFGLTAADPGDLSDVISRQSDLFEYIFTDLTCKADLGTRVIKHAAPENRDWLDKCIGERHAVHQSHADLASCDSVLDRCLKLQASGTPGMTDLDIRNNLIGFLVGALSPIANASLQVLDVLLSNSEALSHAQRAARDDNNALLERCVIEALRFFPNDPVLYRRAVCDATIARGTWRACHIPRDTMVFAWTSSAMFDSTAVRKPFQFRLDRPEDEYFHFGFGQHTCAGLFLTKAMIPGLLKPLLQQPQLRRAPGKDGQLDRGKTHFVQHLWIETSC